MRALLVGNSAQIEGMADAAEAAGMTVEQWRDDQTAAGGEGEIAAIAAALRDLEQALTAADGPGAVLVASDSDAALAAVVVATKTGTPVARVGMPGTAPEGTNARLIRQLADRELASEPGVIVDWVRGTYTERA